MDKAKAVMQSLRDLGFAKTTLGYNILMNVYYRMGDWEKLDILMHETMEKGIFCDNFTFAIRLSAYAAASDLTGIDKIVGRMESNPWVVLDWDIYSIASNGYLKVGLVDKALAMTKKLEHWAIYSIAENGYLKVGLVGKALAMTKKMEQIDAPIGSTIAFDDLLRLYAETRQRDELDRVWMLYKKKGKIYNNGYMAMISSLLKFDEIDTAEKVFEEWESRSLPYDFRIPNFLIDDAYFRKGLMEKAEGLMNKILAILQFDTWFYLANGYLETDQIPKAVEALKKTVLGCLSSQLETQQAASILL